MMLNNKLDQKVREAWTQKHTNTAQVLNTVLNDNQNRDWEKRLQQIEAYKRKQAEAAGWIQASETTG